MNDDDGIFGPPEEPSVAGPPVAGPSTEPIRPRPPETAPIPESARHPIVVPLKESTIGGLPRPLVVAAMVVVLVSLFGGFLIGRATGDGDESAAPAVTGRRSACARALSLSQQVIELQRQALANRTEATRSIALGDESRLQELNTELQALSTAIQEGQAKVTAGTERCRSGGGGGKGSGGKRGGEEDKGGGGKGGGNG
ncbi:MAG: hypothetical protein ACRDH9_05870 [Actinomycetota bacterium]